ncbi:hypothetical protein AGMMS49965_05470 [Bacteroidia bacterium]|nr:hypothetical protein AGMMS49965_05470 [Bacteroidia bacterium]
MSILSATAQTSGSCGTNLTWTLTGVSPSYRTLTISGTGAMENYVGNEMPWFYSRFAITTVVINNGVTSIGNYAFWQCNGFTSVTIPNSVTSIGSYAFSSCSGLSSITIPNNVTSIGDYAFSSCSGLSSVSIPNSVTSIGDRAFTGCSGLTAINVDAANAQYRSVGEVLYNKDMTTLHIYPAGKQGTSFTIPNSVTSIGTDAFYSCTGLTSVTIPNSVTSIGNFAFSYCSNLTSVTIPNSVTSIGRGAFWGCSGLTSIYVHCTTPASLGGSNVFIYVNTNTCTLYVPAGSTSAYRAATQWKDFPNIVEFAATIEQYTITTSAGTGISATTGAGIYNSGTTATVDCTITSDYTFDGWYENSTKVSSSQSYSFTVTAARVLEARAIQNAPEQYTITASAGNGGNISPDGNQTVTHGSEQTYFFTPDAGYEIDQVLIDALNDITAVEAGSYTFTNVTANHTIFVSFKQKAIPTFNIIASAGSGGAISLSGNVNVNQGDSQTFTFAPNVDYEIDQVLIDGTNDITAVEAGSYTFTNVTANHTIFVSFKQKAIPTFSITASAGSGGTISPSGEEIVIQDGNVIVNQGGSQTFIFTPNADYEISQVFVDGVNTAIAVATGSYTFTNVTANHTISVSFIQKATPTFSISASAGANGSVSPSDNVIVSQGGSQTFIFTPNAGYEINQVLIDDVNDATAVSTGNYTVQNITANHTIFVSFKQKQYTITVSASNGGKISPSGKVTVSHGGEQRFVFTPDADYEIANVWIDGVDNSVAVAAGGYRFTNIVAPHTITVSFKQRAAQTCTITASAGNGGNISPSGNVNISEGGSQTFHFTPATGYEIDQVFVDGVNNASAAANGTYPFANVTANHTIAVTFKQKQYTITVTAGANGSISPASNQMVNYGHSSSFDFVPNSGYEINQVLVDGVNNAGAVAARGYTFWDVVANHSIAVTFKPSCRPNLVVQVWDNVLSVVNQPTHNGGYRFESYQWQRNGVDIAGATRDYLYFGTTKDYTSEYSVRLTTSDGQSLQSCPMRLQAVNATLHSYPNPTTGIVTVEDATIQANTKIDIYNTNGQLVKRCAATQNRTTVDISSLPRGTYIVRVNNRQGKIIKN